MDGLLVVDKPVGPTSHDIVQRTRKLLREPRIGHTGTLDPLASGVLPLVVGRATRLAQFLGGGRKEYFARIILGVSTDTRDALGKPQGERYEGPFPSRDAVDRALDLFRGAFLQQPPAFSAKKVDGHRSHRLARSKPEATLLPAAVQVSTETIEVTAADGQDVELRIVCSAGFYVRSLAHDLGEALGTGAHLTALRRTAACGVTLADAVSIAELEAGGRERAAGHVVPLERMLQTLPRLELTLEGTRWAAKGREIGPAQAAGAMPVGLGADDRVRLFDLDGRLLGIAKPSGGSDLLRPVVVLM
jgi:tRNA pseudouridine55 synthase